MAAPVELVALVALAAAAAGCSKSDAANARGREDGPKPVKVERVKEESVKRSIEVVGTLAAVDEVTISSEAEGRVSRLAADLGDRVRAGQMLMELDAEKLQYNADQQKAALARALAKYGASDSQHLPPIEKTPDVVKAQAELVQAKQGFDRAEQLHQRQLVPRQTLDDAQTMLDSKRASYDASLQNAKNLRADIDASEANAKLADRQLRDTTIRAPFDGYVQKRLVNLGEYVKVQTPVMAVVRVDPLKVTAEVPERMAPWVKIDQAVDLRVDAFPDRAITGKVSRMSPAANTSTRAFPFEALVPNGDAQLKPGTFARVRIVSSRVDQVLTLPYAALQYRYGVNRVFVIKDDHLVARELKVGERLGDRIEITGGVEAGETVATSDVDKLVDGMKVSVSTKPHAG
jgi:multidrug efflux pump subunit AcrA (membrane-fusion protein)